MANIYNVNAHVYILILSPEEAVIKHCTGTKLNIYMLLQKTVFMCYVRTTYKTSPPSEEP